MERDKRQHTSARYNVNKECEKEGRHKRPQRPPGEDQCITVVGSQTGLLRVFRVTVDVHMCSRRIATDDRLRFAAIIKDSAQPESDHVVLMAFAEHRVDITDIWKVVGFDSERAPRQMFFDFDFAREHKTRRDRPAGARTRPVKVYDPPG